MTLTRWNPTRDLATLEIERLHRMFDRTFSGEPLAPGAWVPAVDIYENADRDVVVKAELPEMKRDDIKVRVENDVLTIEGERKFETQVDEEKYHRIERGYGTFRRSFSLSANVDASKVSADYRDGVLTVTLPRREEARPKEIKITT